MQGLQAAGIEYNFIFSGQHQATISDITTEFGIKAPDYTLYHGKDITQIGQLITWSIKIIWHGLKHKNKIWKNDENGVVLNHGDTFSTLIGSLLTKICGLKSAHIESGLRSYNLLHPFPEELTRRITFLLSDIYFAPGQEALQNLARHKGTKINTSNNTLIDSLRAFEKSINQTEVDIPNYKYGVISTHRFENIFNRKKLTHLTELIETIAQNKKLLFILHKPTKEKLESFDLLSRLSQNPNIELRPRYSYFQFIKLVKKATFVATDGGSNQEECYYLGKPCLILRKATERPEGLNCNAYLSLHNKERIEYFLKNIASFEMPPVENKQSPSATIINSLAEYR